MDKSLIRPLFLLIVLYSKTFYSIQATFGHFDNA